MKSNSFSQQLMRDSLFSNSLKKEVSFEVWLPKNYDKTEKHLVLYSFCYHSFDMFCGTLSSFIHLDKMPPAIAVNAYIQFAEYGHNYTSEKLSKKGEAYTEFLVTELIPYIERKYNASDFRMALGHSYTAAYENYLLKKNPELFRAYIAIAHEKPEIKVDYTQSIKKINKPTYYFLATAGLDLPKRVQFAGQLADQLKQVKNQSLEIKLAHFATADHNSIVPYAFISALEFIFKDYIALPDRSPDDFIKYHNLLATKDFFNKTIEHNATHYSCGLKNSPDNMAFFLDLAINKKDTAAFKYIENYSLSHRPDGNTLEFLGFFNGEMGNPEKARDLFYLAIKKYDEEGAAFLYNVSYSLSDLYKEQYKNPEMAIKILEDAKKKLDDNFFDFQIARTMIDMDYKLEDALTLLQLFIANKNYSIVSSEYPSEKVYYQFARCYTKLKDKEKADEFIKKALAVNPNYKEAKEFMQNHK